MLRLVHLVDASVPFDAAMLCSLLAGRLPRTQVTQAVLSMGRPPVGLDVPADVTVSRASRPAPLPFATAMALEKRLAGIGADVIIAWSVIGIATLASRRRNRPPMVGVLCDPADARDASRWQQATRQLGHGCEIICTSGTVRRRLVESGTPLEATAVVRPGVDFAAIRRAREQRRCQRASLAVADDVRVFVTLSPPSRSGGQFLAAWATALLHHIWPDAVLIVPGTSREQRRIDRLVEGIYCPQAYRLTGEQLTPAEWLAVADAMLVPALDDVSTGQLAWAMAAGVPIVGSAVPAVAELVADRHNGFLCKPGEPHTLATRIRTAFESPDALQACVQTARQQAYEAFRAERCVDEFLRATGNLADGKPGLVGIQDAAIDA